jgi:hypothetical protein
MIPMVLDSGDVKEADAFRGDEDIIREKRSQ